MKPVRIRKAEFDIIANLVGRIAGIHLSPNKRMMVLSRLSKRIQSLNLSSFTQYLSYLKGKGHDSGELDQMINCLTTKKTDFFREVHQFTILQRLVLPDVLRNKLAQGGGLVRVWSTACSTGEEAYSLAMVLDDFGQQRQWFSWRLLASDIDTEALKKAAAGIYPKEVVAPVQPTYQLKYLRKVRSGGEVRYRVVDALRENILFRRINLNGDPFLFREPVDIVFCRNAVIYFDEPTREQLIRKFSEIQKPGGFLFMGHSEAPIVDRLLYEPIEATVFRRR